MIRSHPCLFEGDIFRTPRFILGAVLFLVLSGEVQAADRRPNVVLIMTDNHGAWTLGCYGNPDIRTPNIDRLASEGMLFSRAFSSNPVCSPTRATFLTGLVPSQHGVHCFLRSGRLQVGPQARSTLANLTSLPEVLREAGYNCGLVGKWHLGNNLNPQEGFDGYWITMPHGGTSTFYDAQIIENGRVRKEPTYLTDFWTEHAVKFIEQNKKIEKPFFLFLAYNGPYSLSRLLLREGRNRHAAHYAEKELPSFPREPTHPWQFANRDYINNPISIRRVATEVSGIDNGVGTIMSALSKHGLDENTIVIFTADQGWVGGHGGFWGMGDHTRPLTARDGMMRIPMIWRHPGKIPAGRKSAIMVSNYDFMPTLLSYLGLGNRMPTEPKSPGRDFEPVLCGKLINQWDNTVFYEFEDMRAIRTERWKYVHRHPNGPHELYDLVSDPSESSNLVDDSAHIGIRRQLRARLDAFYDRYAEPRYDLWRGGGSQTVIHRGIDEELAQLDPAEPPFSGDGFEPADIKLPEGYTVELVAGPPLVEHPMMADFDDRGRLFVAESAGLNLKTKELEEKLPNYIRMLEDTDGDGRFDKSTIFADKMTLPMGALWHEGALYVASPPNIWRLEDTNDDGIADKREVLVSHFGYSGNAASIHGCFLGPEGRIYWCDGRHGHEFRTAEGKITGKGEGSYIFSCKPDGSDVRPHCGGGMDNPVEVDFTDEGEVLGTVNIFYSRPRIDCLVHWLHGGVYPHSEKVLGEFQRTGDLLGPVHKFGHVTVSGVMRYRSGVLDRDFRDNFFVAIFNTGKVLRCELQRHGATFRATQREFLSCTSRDFHPTDVTEDADGSLLVIDTGGWFHLGCPTSQISKPEIKGAIYRIRRKGMTPLVDPWGKRIDWTKLAGSQLVGLLSDTRYKVRQRAIAECAKRGQTIVSALETTVRRRDSRQRRNAVWALTRIGTQKAKAAVRQALHDPAASVRLAACHSIASTADAKAAERLIEILRDDEPQIRREAATALGRIGDSKAESDSSKTVGALLKALGSDIDRTLEHALIHALIQIDDPSETAKGLLAKQPKVRRAALIALDQMTSDELTSAIVSPFLESDDEALRRVALDVFCRHSNWANEAKEKLAHWLSNQEMVQHRADIIRGSTAAFITFPPIGDLVGKVLDDTSTPASTKRLLLGAISDCQSVPLHESWTQPLERMFETDDRGTLEQTLAAISAIKTDRFDEALERIGSEPKRPVLLRVAALEAVSGRGARLSSSSFGLLLGLLGEDAAPKQKARAVQMIGASALTNPQLVKLAPLLEHAGPLELRELIKPFQRNQNEKVVRTFLASVEKSRGFWSLLPHEFSDVVKRYPPELLSLANPLLDQLKEQDERKQTRLEELWPILERGDAKRGQVLFVSEKTKCGACHRVGKDGGTIGPDLSAIGRIRSSRDLAESIVFPSASFAREYEPYVVATTDGKVLAGLIARETEQTIYIQQQLGEPVPIARNEIEDIAPSTVTIMPKGLDQALSEQDLADVIAYLSSLEGSP